MSWGSRGSGGRGEGCSKGGRGISRSGGGVQGGFQDWTGPVLTNNFGGVVVQGLFHPIVREAKLDAEDGWDWLMQETCFLVQRTPRMVRFASNLVEMVGVRPEIRNLATPEKCQPILRRRCP